MFMRAVSARASVDDALAEGHSTCTSDGAGAPQGLTMKCREAMPATGDVRRRACPLKKQPQG